MNQDPLLDHVEAPPSLGEVAFQAIKKAILDNRLEPGVIYNERAIAEELGFSKTPVHEALTTLAVKGFITILPRKGFQVVGLTEKHIRDMYKFRRLLETAVIMDIVPKLTDESLDTIESYLEQIAKTSDPNKLGDLDRAFHSYLAFLTDNRYIIDALSNIWDLCAWIAVSMLIGDSRNHKPMIQEHLTIGKWLKKRDADKAAKAIDEHLRIAEKRWMNQFASEDPLNKVI
jgi:DNA-binding GntR family transcriptional regulator